MKSKRVILTFVIVATVTLCLILLGGTGAFTQEDKPCTGDVEKFCQGVQPGGGEYLNAWCNTRKNSHWAASFVLRK